MLDKEGYRQTLRMFDTSLPFHDQSLRESASTLRLYVHCVPCYDLGNITCFERRILREIYGPSCVNTVWRIKCNDELYSLYKEPNIVKIIKLITQELL
jgi:hypothetical protein